MLVPWSVAHKLPLLSTATPTGRLNCSGKTKVSKVLEVILKRKISPSDTKADREIHITFLLLSTARGRGFQRKYLIDRPHARKHTKRECIL